MLSLHAKLSQKKEKGLELVFMPLFPHKCEEKYSFCYILLIDQISLSGCLSEILGNICIAIVCKSGCDVMNFEDNLIFLIKPFFLHDQKVATKA